MLWSYRFFVTNRIEPTDYIGARLSIINSISVAYIQSFLRAKAPYGVLDEARKQRRKCRIKPSCIDMSGSGFEDVRAAARLITGETIRVVGPEPMQYPRAAQKIVHQGVDGDHADADLRPKR